jgi:hypothetical protein
MLAPDKAGASFTPSPVIATISPFSYKEATILIFWSGVTREKIDRSTELESSSSDICLSSSPLTGDSEEVLIASSFPIAAAVR